MTAPSLDKLSLRERTTRRIKVELLKARRLARWATHHEEWRRPNIAGPDRFPHRVYENRIPLSRCDAGADPVLEAGKRWNIALAAPHFHGLKLTPAQPLSFWRVLGRPTAARGFRHGMELRGGCIVPTIGGGLCLLSNELFAAACELGWTVLERHGHTMDVAPEFGRLWGLDATLFWPFVDLRIAPRRGSARLDIRVEHEHLLVGISADTPNDAQVKLSQTHSQRRGQFRENTIERRVFEGDREVSREVIAENRKKLLTIKEQRRNCLTCNVPCSARPKDLP